MKIAVVFPSVMYREGQAGVARLIRAIETIGYDEVGVYDHVVMGHPTATRRAPFYPPQMPVIEALTLLAFAAGITERIGLGTGVLVLPQRQTVLVAKQVSSLDTLSGGRVRLGVGSGWQRAEYQALGEDFGTRGRRLGEAIRLLRQCWAEPRIDFDGEFHRLEAIAMEPKPPRGGRIPIWVGGTRPAALKRAAQLADGWMAMTAPGDPPIEDNLARFRDYLAAAGRNPGEVGLQMGLAPDPLDKAQRKRFYAEPERLLERVVQLKALGFDHTSIDCVPIFQQGHRSVDALIDYLAGIHALLEPELRDAPQPQGRQS